MTDEIRSQFPLLTRMVHTTRPLVYLDNAATTQKPRAVIEAIEKYYLLYNSNVHRGAHAIAAEATTIYEQARIRAAMLLHAALPEEIVFTRGTTESINLVAESWGRTHLKHGDEILITEMEHHANIVPWQLIAQRTGAVVVAVPIPESHVITLDVLEPYVTERTKMIAITQMSNTLGVVNPVRDICQYARSRAITTLVDGAQAILHTKVNVCDIGCDFYVFSAHKLYGPTGIGVLYGRYDQLNEMPPYQGGGAMIESVSLTNGTTYQKPPLRFEAGTPNIAGAAGLRAALEWFGTMKMRDIHKYEQRLVKRLVDGLETVPGINILGAGASHTALVSFTIQGMHSYDLGILLDEQGFAIRTGHHCTMPLLQHYGVESVARASVALYNTPEEINLFIEAVHRSLRMLQ